MLLLYRLMCYYFPCGDSLRRTLHRSVILIGLKVVIVKNSISQHRADIGKYIFIEYDRL